MSDEPRPARLFERALAQLDVFPLGALLRAAIGYALVPTFRDLIGGGANDWRIVPWFVVVLVGVKLLPAALRAVTPFSSAMKAIWVERRDLGKRFDSYQWRKLLWFGVGTAAYIAASGDFDASLIALSVATVLAGCLGEYVWHRFALRVLASERQ